jgi:uncharacterized protein (DUF1810 family)
MIKTLKRFKDAQKKMYNQAYIEIKNGKKESHWIWYIFPQLEQLGYSNTAKYYGIKNLNEAKRYYKNDYLRNNLLNICQALLDIDNKTIKEIVGYDDVKVHSCITLFLQVDKNNTILLNVLKKYFNDVLDKNTLIILAC